MRRFLTTALTTIALASPSMAQTSAAELMAMSNDSAAETLVRESSAGDMTAAQIKLALDNFSPAERKAFFDEAPATRVEILSCMKKTDSGESAAESCAIPGN